MKNIDEQIIELLTPVLAKANAIDSRRDSLCIIINLPSTERRVWCNITGIGCGSLGTYGIDAALDKVKAFDPAADKREAIEKLKAELAALENNTEPKGNLI